MADPRTAADPLWSGFGLIAALDARLSGPMPFAVGGVSIDTRTLAAGDLFVALKGDNSDGHDHVAAAFAMGAAAAVVDEAHGDALRGARPLLVVDDTLEGLRRLGLAARARSAAAIVAVTGSVGKTGTKEALRLVLSGAGETHASAASYNNHWGVPLTLARMPKAAMFGVFEIGMNHAGEIGPLVGMVEPDVALITTVAPVHLEFFASVGEIADAKAEIFSGLKPGGTAIVNRDIDTFYRLATRAAGSPAGRLLSFGAHPEADARLDSIAMDPAGSDLEVILHGRPMRLRVGAPGRHVAMNALAVLLAAEAVGMDVDEAAAALAHLTAGPGRGERSSLPVADGSFTLIDESYNANPASMRAAIALLGGTRPAAGARRIAALGEMRELGPDAGALHAALVPELVENGVDLVFAGGPLVKPLYDALPEAMRGRWAPTAAEIEGPLIEAIGAGDVVMIKGSNGSRMGPVVAALKARFGADQRSSAA